MWTKRSVLAAIVSATLGGCASLEQQDWYNKAHDSSLKAANVAAVQTTKAISIATDRGGKALVRMQHYLAKQDLLKTFYDAGEHSEAAVLTVLHQAGIRSSKKSAASGSTAAGSSTRSNGTQSGKSVPLASPALPGAMPEHFDGVMKWPLEAGIVSSEFGARWGKMHKGLDIAADVGEPVYAAAPGEVIYASDGMRGYGNVVILRHDRQRTTLYAHNSALKVKLGDRVAQGDLVALLGSTGHSTGPHVHFEVRDGDKPINPRTLLATKMMSFDEHGPAAIRSSQVAVLNRFPLGFMATPSSGP